MKVKDFADLWAAQAAEKHGANEASREHWSNSARRSVAETVSSWGEGFAVFFGDKVGAFYGDAGAARHAAREARDSYKTPNVRIKHVKG